MSNIQTLATLYGIRLNILALRHACDLKIENVARLGLLSILNGAIMRTHDLIAGLVSEDDYICELSEEQCPFEEEFIESIVEERDYAAKPQHLALFKEIIAEINEKTPLCVQPIFE